MSKDGRFERARRYHEKLGLPKEKNGITQAFYEEQLDAIFRGVPEERKEFENSLKKKETPKAPSGKKGTE